MSTAHFFSSFFTFLLGFTFGFALVFAWVFAWVFALAFTLAEALAAFLGTDALVAPAPTFAGARNTGVNEIKRVKATREATLGRRTRLAADSVVRINIMKLR